MTSAAALVLAFVLSSGGTAQSAPAGRDVGITAADGTKLAATYYPAAAPGPAVLLLHMCNTTRKSWEPLAPPLAAAGFHVLSMDFRGFGESGGDRYDTLAPADAQKIITEKWPGDVDSAYTFLTSQPGVDKARIGIAGGSCGVTQAVQAASRHTEVRSLALLAGPVDLDGLRYLTEAPWLPVFAAAADDDQYDRNAPDLMRWVLTVSGNPRNKFSGFKDGKHGTEIFGPHPELIKQMVAWYVDTLVTKPADPKAASSVKNSPTREFWRLALSPEGVGQAIQTFYDARARGSAGIAIPESQLNLAGYLHLQAGRATDAIQLFRLNTLIYPNSANTFDSLGDAYLANGQNELALRSSEKAIALLDKDKSSDDIKKAIRTSAEAKIAKLKGPDKK